MLPLRLLFTVSEGVDRTLLLLSDCTALMIAPSTALPPRLVANPPKPPRAASTASAAFFRSTSPTALLVVVVVAVVVVVVVVVSNCLASRPPATSTILGEALEKLVTAKGTSLPPTSHCTPSSRARFSEISTMIASTTTCSWRVSSWRISSPIIRCTSGLAATMIALVPSSRVTMAGPRLAMPLPPLPLPLLMAAGAGADAPSPAAAGTTVAELPLVPLLPSKFSITGNSCSALA